MISLHIDANDASDLLRQIKTLAEPLAKNIQRCEIAASASVEMTTATESKGAPDVALPPSVLADNGTVTRTAELVASPADVPVVAERPVSVKLSQQTEPAAQPVPARRRPGRPSKSERQAALAHVPVSPDNPSASIAATPSEESSVTANPAPATIPAAGVVAEDAPAVVSAVPPSADAQPAQQVTEIGDVRAAIHKVMGAYEDADEGMLAAYDVLHKFGYNKVNHVKPEHYAAVIQACHKHVAERAVQS